MGGQFEVQMNPQQYMGNQAAMRPSVVYMFPVGNLIKELVNRVHYVFLNNFIENVMHTCWLAENLIL